jgi:hypothetical protein
LIRAGSEHLERCQREQSGYFNRESVPKDLEEGLVEAFKEVVRTLNSVVLGRCFDEARFLRWNGGKAAKTHHRVRAHRAWRRNAERMVRKWQRAH